MNLGVMCDEDYNQENLEVTEPFWASGGRENAFLIAASPSMSPGPTPIQAQYPH